MSIRWEGDIYSNKYFQAIGFFVFGIVISILIVYGAKISGAVSSNALQALVILLGLFVSIGTAAVFWWWHRKSSLLKSKPPILTVEAGCREGVLVHLGNGKVIESSALELFILHGKTLKSGSGQSSPFNYGHVFVKDLSGNFEIVCSYIKWKKINQNLFSRFAKMNVGSIVDINIHKSNLLKDHQVTPFFLGITMGGASS